MLGACKGPKRSTEIVGWGRATPAADLTVSVRVRGLPAAARCTYRFTQGSCEEPGRGVPHRPRADHRRRGSLRALRGRGRDPGQTASRGSTASRPTRGWRPSTTTSTSTWVTRSTRTPRSPARRLRYRAGKWEKYKLGLALAPLRTLRASAGLYSHWDDHEFINDFSRAENGDAIYAAGVKAFATSTR